MQKSKTGSKTTFHSCLYCDNPSARAVQGEQIIKRKKLFGGFLALINAGWESSKELVQNVIADSTFISCLACSKVYYILCNQDISKKCIGYASSLLTRTDLIPNLGLEEVVNFMSNEKIQKVDLSNKLLAVTAVPVGKVIHLHILFDKYYASLSRGNGGKLVMEHMWYLDRFIGGGNFLVQ